MTKAQLLALSTVALDEGCMAMVSDPATGKGRLVYSDGTNWLYASDASVVS